MTLFKQIVLVLILLVAVSGFAEAQQVKSHPELTGLLLEVVYFKNSPPAYQRVYWSTDRPGGTWYGRWGRIAGWQLPSGALPVRAINLVPSLQGDLVTLKISVFRGVEFNDTEEAVTTYTIRENETVVIKELKRLGIEPFQIKVIRAAPTNTALPAVVNKTQSVEVISIDPVLSTLPTFALTIHNLTSKNVSALQILAVKNGKTELSSLPQGKEGAPLIAAGAYAVQRVSVATRAEPAPGGFIPSSPPSQKIVIASVVFEDGTYEGEVEGAASFRGFVAGRKMELKRMLPLLESALAAADTDQADAPARFRSQIELLGYDLDAGEFAALVRAFPTLTPQRLKGSVDVAIHGVRRDFLDELQRAQNTSTASAGGFRFWLTNIKERYSTWLARL